MPTPSYSSGSVVVSQARDETGIGSNPVGTALKDADIARRLSEIDDEFVNAPLERGVLGWTFLEDETIIVTKAVTPLNGAIASGASSLIVDDASIWDDPGGTTLEAGFIRTGNNIYDFFPFEEISSNTLSVVSGIQFAHTDNSNVSKIYKLPTNFGKPRAMFRQANGFEFIYKDDDFRQVPWANEYFVKTLTSTNDFSASFVVFRYNIQGSIEFKFNYQKASVSFTDATLSTQNISGPNGTARRFYIEKLKEYIWSFLGEEEDALLANRRAQDSLEKTFSQWSTHSIQARNNLSFNW